MFCFDLGSNTMVQTTWCFDGCQIIYNFYWCLVGWLYFCW